jgi:hypothetical protein
VAALVDLRGGGHLGRLTPDTRTDVVHEVSWPETVRFPPTRWSSPNHLIPSQAVAFAAGGSHPPRLEEQACIAYASHR